MYFRRLRTVVNSGARAPGASRRVYDAKVTPGRAGVDARLRHVADPAAALTFAGQRTQLFSAIQARRNAFANDCAGARQPERVAEHRRSTRSSTRWSTATAAQFVELYNPSATEAVDLSGWTLSGAIDRDDPAGHGHPAARHHDVRRQRPDLPRHLRRRSCSSAAPSPARSRRPAP